MTNKFEYLEDNDDISRLNRFSYSYIAQFEIINNNQEFCAASIILPCEGQKTLYKRDDNLSFLVYAECKIKPKSIIINIIHLIDVKNKIESDINDSKNMRIINFFYSILYERYYDNSINIIRKWDCEYIVHKIVDKIFFNIINFERAKALDFHQDLCGILLDKMYKLETYKKVNVDLNNLSNLSHEEIVKLWFTKMQI